MSERIPTLGYRSRSAAVLALQAQSVPDREIAERMGVPRRHVSALAASARRPRKQFGQRSVTLSWNLYDGLKSMALARGIATDKLIQQLLEECLARSAQP